MLTDKAIRSAKPSSHVSYLRDAPGGIRGLGVAVAPSGAKAFFLSFTSPLDGKRKKMTLGAYPNVSLSTARAQAVTMRSVINKGQDPAVEKKRAAATDRAKRDLGTLEDLIDAYITYLRTDNKRVSSEVERIKNKEIPKLLLSTKANLITRDDILSILAVITDRGAPVHSDNVRTYLRAAYEFGINAPNSPRWRNKFPPFALQTNPVATIKRSVAVRRAGQRALSTEEITHLWRATGLSESMLLTLKFLIATGQRVEEVLQAQWSEFNLDDKLWTIPGARRKNRGKTHEPHLVPLTQFHLDLLQEIADASSSNPSTTYLFPTAAGAPRRADSLRSSLAKFIKAEGIESFSPRDLRRTFKTRAGAIGIPLEMRNRLQGHAMTDIGSVHYDRYDYLDEKRQAMQVWTNWLKKEVNDG